MEINAFTIRPAAPADLPTVYMYLCDLEEMLLDYEPFKAVYERNLTNSAIGYWLAEAGDVPVGFLSCHVQPLLHHAGLVAEIQELYVLPDWRGRGVGQQLIDHVAVIGRREGWVNLEVTTNRRRVRTHAFYERIGFTNTSLKFVRKL